MSKKSMLLQLPGELMAALGHAAVKAGKPKAVLVRAAIKLYLSGESEKEKEPYEDCLFYRPGKVRGCRFPLWRERAGLYEPGCDKCRYDEARVFYGPAEPPEDEAENDYDTTSKA